MQTTQFIRLINCATVEVGYVYTGSFVDETCSSWFTRLGLLVSRKLTPSLKSAGCMLRYVCALCVVTWKLGKYQIGLPTVATSYKKCTVSTIKFYTMFLMIMLMFHVMFISHSSLNGANGSHTGTDDHPMMGNDTTDPEESSVLTPHVIHSVQPLSLDTCDSTNSTHVFDQAVSVLEDAMCECPICYSSEYFLRAYHLVNTTLSHMFCPSCIDYLKSHDSPCPICRYQPDSDYHNPRAAAPLGVLWAPDVEYIPSNTFSNTGFYPEIRYNDNYMILVSQTPANGDLVYTFSVSLAPNVDNGIIYTYTHSFDSYFAYVYMFPPGAHEMCAMFQIDPQSRSVTHVNSESFDPQVHEHIMQAFDHFVVPTLHILPDPFVISDLNGNNGSATNTDHHECIACAVPLIIPTRAHNNVNSIMPPQLRFPRNLVAQQRVHALLGEDSPHICQCQTEICAQCVTGMVHIAVNENIKRGITTGLPQLFTPTFWEHRISSYPRVFKSFTCPGCRGLRDFSWSDLSRVRIFTGDRSTGTKTNLFYTTLKAEPTSVVYAEREVDEYGNVTPEISGFHPSPYNPDRIAGRRRPYYNELEDYSFMLAIATHITCGMFPERPDRWEFSDGRYRKNPLVRAPPPPRPSAVTTTLIRQQRDPVMELVRQTIVNPAIIPIPFNPPGPPVNPIIPTAPQRVPLIDVRILPVPHVHRPGILSLIIPAPQPPHPVDAPVLINLPQLDDSQHSSVSSEASSSSSEETEVSISSSEESDAGDVPLNPIIAPAIDLQVPPAVPTPLIPIITVKPEFVTQDEVLYYKLAKQVPFPLYLFLFVLFIIILSIYLEFTYHEVALAFIIFFFLLEGLCIILMRQSSMSILYKFVYSFGELQLAHTTQMGLSSLHPESHVVRREIPLDVHNQRYHLLSRMGFNAQETRRIYPAIAREIFHARMGTKMHADLQRFMMVTGKDYLLDPDCDPSILADTVSFAYQSMCLIEERFELTRGNAPGALVDNFRWS
jgi:hypothetical protein